MTKRAFRIAALAVLVVACMFAATLITACNNESSYYLSTSSDNWKTYNKAGDIPAGSKFQKNDDGSYSLTVDLEAGASFAIYKTGSKDSLIKEIYSTAGKLELNSGKVSVKESGKYVLTIDVESGELSYTFTSSAPQNVAVSSVSLNRSSLPITVGDADVTLTATVYPTNATNKNVSWESNATNIATVSDNGVVHAVAEGSAVITVKTEDGGFEDYCTVLVSKAAQGNVDVTSIEIAGQNTVEVEERDNVTLTVNVLPANATNKAYSVVVVSGGEHITHQIVNNGLKITGVSQGTAVIKLQSVSNPDVYSAELTINVTEAQSVTKDVTSITITGEEDSLTLDEGDNGFLTVTVLPADATDKSYTIEINGDQDVISYQISDSVLIITAQKAGTVTIKAVSVSNPEIESAPYTITVSEKQVALQQIFFDGASSLSMMLGDEPETLAVGFYPANATDKAYTVQVVGENNGIASFEVVSGGVKVTALGVGTVTIKLVATNFPGVESANFVVTVNPPEVSEIVVDPERVTLEVEDTYNLAEHVSVLPATAVAVLSYESSDTAVATVGAESGLITAVASGTATITITDINGVSAKFYVTVRKAVNSVSLNKSTATIYALEGTLELTVSFNPEDATNQNYTIEVYKDGTKMDADNGIISYSKSGNTINVTAVAFGTVTLKVISDDNNEATASCEITVSNDDAVPALSQDSLTITELGITSGAISIELEGGSFTFTATPVANIVTVTASDTSFTVKSAAFGSTTITVAVSYGSGKTVNLTLNVLVTSAYFYLTGPMDGGNSWDTQTSEEAARTANRLLEYVEAGKYALTREFVAGDNFYVLPAGLDTNWAYALKASDYFTSSNSHIVQKSGSPDNAVVDAAGLYKVTLDLTGSKASWTVEVLYIYPTNATVSGNTNLKENDVTSTTLTLAIDGPTDKNVGDITWTVEEAYQDWLSLSLSNGNLTCLVNLLKFESEQDEVAITITVTVNYGDGKSLVKEVVIKILSAAGAETAVDSVEFAQSSYEFSGLSGISVSATAKSDTGNTPTNDKIVYSIVDGGDVKYNGDGANAFTIDPETGAITAIAFGTIKVRATSDADATKYAEATVLIYSEVYSLVGVYGKNPDKDNWGNNAQITSVNSDHTSYTWTDINLYATNFVLFVYTNSDWDNGKVSNGDYLGTVSGGGSINASSGSSSYFNIDATGQGVYTITLDISNATPVVNFEKTADLAGDTEVTMNFIVANQSTWASTTLDTKTVAIGSVGGVYTITLSCSFTGNESAISSVGSNDWIAFYVYTGSNWEMTVTSITISGITPSSNYWTSGTSTKFTCAKSAVTSKTITVVCTFDSNVTLTTVAVTVS